MLSRRSTQGATRTEIQNKYGVIVGVAGASLDVARGEISVLMGLSVRGKSTLLRAANGLNTVTRGHVVVRDGESTIDVATCGTCRCAGCGGSAWPWCFSSSVCCPGATVRQNVGFGLELRGEPAAKARAIVDEKLELVGLSQWADRHSQRTVRRHAAARRPGARLRDGRRHSVDGRAFLRSRSLDPGQAAGRTAHSPGPGEEDHPVRQATTWTRALRLGDRISIQQNGRIIQTGTAEDIVLAPADD